MPLRATLFDMDGLLIDSEILWHEAEVDILGALGVPLSHDAPRQTKGIITREVVRYWYERFPWEGPGLDEVGEQIIERVGELVEEKGVLLPGAVRAIELTSERGPIALASSTTLRGIHRALDHFGLRERFATICSAEFEPYGKPHPAVFLTAAQTLGVAPTDCLVFEDSPAGVLAGKAGRMTVVAVPVEEDVTNPAMGLADLVLPSLEALEPNWLDERFA